MGMGGAISFSCRGNPPVVALIPETLAKSWMGRVGTGALPYKIAVFPRMKQPC